MYSVSLRPMAAGFFMSNQLRRALIIAGVFVVSAAQAQLALPEHLYYRFNEGSGTSTANTASPGSGAANGTLVGSLGLGATGVQGGALAGATTSESYVDTGWATNLGTGNWTIAFWHSSLGSVSSTVHYLFGDGGAGVFRGFTGGVAGGQGLILRGPLTDVLISNLSLTENNHVAFVYDSSAGNVKGYLNGVLNTTVNQGALNLNGTGFLVGNYQSSQQGLASGRWMDEFMVFGRALSASEVNDAMNMNVVPEPATMSLLVLGALAARRRRKNS